MQDECWIHPYTGKNGYGIKLPRYDCAVCHRERERNRRAA